MPPPDFWGTLGTFLERFGLPLVLAVVFGWVIWILLRYLEREKARELVALEARWAAERTDRIAAEHRVAELTSRWEHALAILGNIERELIRASGRRDR